MARHDYTEVDKAILEHCRVEPWVHPVWCDAIRQATIKLFDKSTLESWWASGRVTNTISKRLTTLKKQGLIDYKTADKRWVIKGD